MQSDSPPEAGTTPEPTSDMDFWRSLAASNASRADFNAHTAASIAAIEQHAQVEHPHLAWDAQAAVFTTGRFTEGRAR